jgi:hypothetical protein
LGQSVALLLNSLFNCMLMRAWHFVFFFHKFSLILEISVIERS